MVRPILLKIKGLNSFEEEQVIDFDRLTSKGLFGIFGATGSGKTSIIDAITLALYGEISRYEGEGRGKKFINVNMENSKVSLEFAISGIDGEERYVAERGYKRHNESQKVMLARLYKKTEAGEEVLADKTTQVTEAVENIIGLGYKDFSKTVVLPQGKFSEFLLLANTDRRNMLERVFHLEKYGENLLEAIRAERNVKVQKLSILNTKLDMYGEVTPNIIKENEMKLKLLDKELDELKTKQKEVAEESNSLKNVQTLCKQLKSYEDKLNSISDKDAEIEEIKIFLIRANQAKLIIPSYTELNETRRLYEENEENLKAHEELYNKLVADEKEAYSKLSKIVSLKNEEVPKLDDKVFVLRQAISISKDKEKIEAERKALLQEHKRIKIELDAIECEKNKLENQRQSLKDELKDVAERKKLIQATLANKKSVENACRVITKINDHEARVDDFAGKRKVYKEKVVEYKKELKLLEKQEYSYEVEVLRVYNHVESEYEKLKEEINITENNIEEEKKELSALQATIRKNERNNIIAIVAEELEDEKPCPVCGALQRDVPTHKAFSDNLNVLFDQEQSLKVNIESKKTSLDNFISSLLKLEVLSKEVKGYKEQIKNEIQLAEEDTLNVDISELEVIFKDLVQKIINLNTEKEVLLARIQKDEEVASCVYGQIQEIKDKIEVDRKSLEEAYQGISSKEINKLNEVIKLYDDELIDIIDKEEVKNKNIDELNLKLEELNEQYQRIKSKSDEVIVVGREKSGRIKELESQILELSQGKEIKSYLEEVEARKDELITNEESARVAYENINKELSKELEMNARLREKKYTVNTILVKQEENFDLLTKKHDFKDIEDVLKYSITEEYERLKESEIRIFEDNKNDVVSNIKRLRREIQNIDIENIDERLSLSINQKETLDAKILEDTQRYGITKQNIRKMKIDFENITMLDKEKKALDDYVDILVDLSKVLEGKKFVEFVAKKQLKYIVVDASSRLKDMSSGRYALELDDTEFIIRDDHYGGLRRSPKTLSGGETFMTSLCLALALSSKIQLKNRSTLEFFFLDEGFGTLDLGSLDIVMNSLIKLQSQKMRVGVISHVEEMKSRIPAKLEVIPANQGLHGSLVYLE